MEEIAMTLRNTMLTVAAVTTGMFLSAQTASAVTTNASVNIVTSPSITKTADLDFGDVIPSSGGTVTIDTLGARSVSGSSVLGTAPGNAAQFTLNGGVGASYTVTISPSAILTGPGDDMYISSFSHNASGFLTTGTETFSVGGSLDVNPSQAAGTYTGTFDVDVNYN
jgi:hypothetical protein